MNDQFGCKHNMYTQTTEVNETIKTNFDKKKQQLKYRRQPFNIYLLFIPIHKILVNFSIEVRHTTCSYITFLIQQLLLI